MARPLDPDVLDVDDPDPRDWLPPSASPWVPRRLAPRLEPLIEPLRRPIVSVIVGALAAGLALVLVVALIRPGAVPVERRLPRAGGSEEATASPSGEPGAGSGAAGGPSGPGSSAGSSSTSPPAGLTVQAAGAVARGGVYDVPAGARVDDLVRAAGGLAPDADVDRINLAAPLTDGERIWIPRRGDLAVPQVVAGGTGPGSGGAAVDAGAGGGGDAAGAGPINLNTATADELDRLPGVGPATAAAILAYRDEHGRFSSVDELLEVRGIGEAKLDALRSAVTV